jgi:predicted lipoprotein
MKRNLLLFMTLPFTVGGCGDSSSKGTSGVELPAFDRLGLLKEISETVIQPRYVSFIEQSQALKLATDNLCQSLTAATPWATAVAPVQTEWKETMALWQEIEAFQFGPLADEASTLRYDIYTWPLVNACAVDRQIAVMAQDPAAYALSTNDSTKSLSAMEYLLFDNDSLHACKDTVEETQGWNEKPEASRLALRCDYLKFLAADLVTQAESLKNKWNDGTQGYHYQLVAAASDSELQSRINVITDSLFYLDATVKDKKLGAPLGLNASCKTGVCPESIEHTFAHESLRAVQHNVLGLQAAFQAGFDDYLKAAGGEELAIQMETDLEKAASTAKALAEQNTLASFIASLDQAACAATTADDRKSEICALYQDIKAITDELKTEFVAILKLSTPAQSSGDND